MDTSLPRLLWIGLGGACGTMARWLFSGFLLQALGSSFPYGTLAVNVIGSFLLGAIMVVGTQTEAISETVRLALTVGVMGGFTTYSTFNYETIEYARRGAWGMVLANVSVTLLSCAIAGVLGLGLGRWIAES